MTENHHPCLGAVRLPDALFELGDLSLEEDRSLSFFLLPHVPKYIASVVKDEWNRALFHVKLPFLESLRRECIFRRTFLGL